MQDHKKWLQSYTFEEVGKITTDIIEHNHRLILIAGASASGKSFIAEQLVQSLEQQQKKVLLISSDNYYSDNSALQYLIYGTFDHPNLIEYDLLAHNLQEYFTQGSTTLPHYSFTEKRRTEYTSITESYDSIIVEWLYTINKLSQHPTIQQLWVSTINIFVHADLEEIIFRRIIRDQARVSEPLHVIIDVMSKVFPMRNVFGETQKNLTDIIIENTFQVMNKEWKKSLRKRTSPDLIASYWKYTSIQYSTDYIYNDTENNKDCVIISEIYDTPQSLLRKVIITKRNIEADQASHEQYESISLDIYQVWVITDIHTLLQLAWLKFIKSYNKTITTYHVNNQEKIIKEKMGMWYELQS